MCQASPESKLNGVPTIGMNLGEYQGINLLERVNFGDGGKLEQYNMPRFLQLSERRFLEDTY